MEEIAVGVGTALVLGLLGWVAGVFKAGKNVRHLRTKIRRAYKDYELWAERQDRELADELATINEDYAARGLFDSGIRLAAQQKARDAATLDNKEALTQRTRAVDNAFDELRKVDSLWLAFTVDGVGWRTRLKGAWRALTKPPTQLEELLDEALEHGDDSGV